MLPFKQGLFCLGLFYTGRYLHHLYSKLENRMGIEIQGKVIPGYLD
jgi:hypothetical protein